VPFVDSLGCRIYYRLEGDAAKPLLVLVHSLGADHGMWDAQMPGLLSRFRVLRLDLRGHGASDAPAGDYTIAQLARDVLAAVDASGNSRFAYCGLSLGGAIGQWLGANAAERIEKLVLANTSPRLDPGLMEDRRLTVLARGVDSLEDVLMKRYFTASTLASRNPAVESIRAVLLATDPVGYAGCCAALRDSDQRALLGSINVPVLVIGGQHDVAAPWSGHGEVLANGIAGAKAVLLNAAHLSNVEKPSSFLAALLDFLLPATSSANSFEEGMAVRRSVLGDGHVDRAVAARTELTREFQEFITRYVWGMVWTRPGLDLRTRRLLALAITASLGRWEEFQLHVKTGLSAELETPDLKEVLLQVAVYAGVPAANTGFRIASEEVQK
jgi:3-oxoadipate enol-lactonase / 4-carboxymuconolactone decarboxylase